MRTLPFRMHTRHVRASVLALALALTASLAMDVEAKWARYHALGCMTREGQPHITGDALADTPATQPRRSATTPTPAPHAQLCQYQATLQHLARRLQRLESIRNVL